MSAPGMVPGSGPAAGSDGLEWADRLPPAALIERLTEADRRERRLRQRVAELEQGMLSERERGNRARLEARRVWQAGLALWALGIAGCVFTLVQWIELSAAGR